MGKSLRIGIFIPVKLLVNLLASCTSINFDFLPLHLAQFDKSNIFPFLVLTDFGFLLCVFFVQSKH